MRKKAFSLIELMIVVSILGIMAAIVLPLFQGNLQKTREAAAKKILQTLREQIELYAINHNDTPPGYVNGVTGQRGLFLIQLAYCTNIDGEFIPSKVKTGDYVYGPYLTDFPKNPFNNSLTVMDHPDGMDMIAQASGSKTDGWLYKAQTREIRLDWPGTDSEGVAYYDY